MNTQDMNIFEEDRRIIFKLIRDVAEREQQNNLKTAEEIRIIHENLKIIQEELDNIWEKIEKLNGK